MYEKNNDGTYTVTGVLYGRIVTDIFEVKYEAIACSLQLEMLESEGRMTKEAVIEMRNQGMTMPEIAKRLNVSITVLETFLIKNNITITKDSVQQLNGLEADRRQRRRQRFRRCGEKGL